MKTPIASLLCDTTDQMRDIIRHMDHVSASKCGLSYRAGKVYVSAEGIVVANADRRDLEYYGGFEYVDKESVHPIGGNVFNGYTFYSCDDERVLNAVAYYKSYMNASARSVA